MKYSRLWISAVIIAVVVLISFAFSVPRAYDGIKPTETTITPVAPFVTVRDIFKKGTHTISGSIEAPNACTTIDTQVLYIASSTEHILVTISMPEDVGICLEVPAVLKFSATVDAPAGLPTIVMVNGMTASTTSL